MSTPTAPDIDAVVSGLREMLEEKRFQDVVDSAPGHLSHDPSHRDLLYSLAVAQRMLLRIPDALATLTTLETWHPGYPRLYQEARPLLYLPARCARGHCRF